MKLICERESLLQKVLVVQKAIDPKNKIPILSNILLTAENDTLTLTGYDLKIGIRTSINCKVEEPGSLTIPYSIFSEILSIWSGKEVKIELLSSPQVKVSSDKNFQKINYLEADDYPNIPDLKETEESKIVIKSSILKDSLRKTMFATNPNDPRPFMGGVYMHVSESGVLFVATDGHRLAIKSNDEKIKLKTKTEMIIPVRAATEITKILPAEDTEIKVLVKSNMFGLNFNNTSFISKLIEAKFPDYTEVIPTEYKGRCIVNTQVLMNAIRASSIMAQARESRNIIKLEIKDDILICTATTQDLGTAYEEVKIEKEGINIKASFNSRYILDILSSIDDDEILIEYSGPLEPAVFKTKDEKYTCVLMPIRFVE